ncbi:hypothetical protein SARC_13635 [Sphaeroforma arctica JP610]|uniref:Uncharacterized protein n=1 Tax=Sphaeroforma arctica JP610 TaxID=667725 RepID=A0A0L0FAN5_9EUKA|nr:hypothetical protein SARC_13635 [Sphaeroforma arctica JP610]KNC73809.1 hypothetical protein SARC_13635 [Sphaeroforma arctica JP610]|eukprot:XP_014147711.1 hypothetical protein SARC_13635 [Sphaeroforma arctica JP610]
MCSDIHEHISLRIGYMGHLQDYVFVPGQGPTQRQAHAIIAQGLTEISPIREDPVIGATRVANGVAMQPHTYIQTQQHPVQEARERKKQQQHHHHQQQRDVDRRVYVDQQRQGVRGFSDQVRTQNVQIPAHAQQLAPQTSSKHIQNDTPLQTSSYTQKDTQQYQQPRPQAYDGYEEEHTQEQARTSRPYPPAETTPQPQQRTRNPHEQSHMQQQHQQKRQQQVQVQQQQHQHQQNRQQQVQVQQQQQPQAKHHRPRVTHYVKVAASPPSSVYTTCTNTDTHSRGIAMDEPRLSHSTLADSWVDPMESSRRNASTRAGSWANTGNGSDMGSSMSTSWVRTDSGDYEYDYEEVDEINRVLDAAVTCPIH